MTTLGTNTKGRLDIDLDLHTWMIGQSGVGKSTVMTNAAIQVMQDGDGLAIIDPHGPTADKIANFVPRHRMNDVIVYDLSLPRIPSIIPRFKNAQEEQLFKSGFVSALRSIYKDRWGDETERVITGALEATTEFYGYINPVAIYLFIARDSFRRMVLANCKNPLLADFAEQYDEKLRPSEQMAKFSPPLNKVDAFVQPIMRTAVSNEKPIDWLRAMDERKIIIVRIPKGEIGEEISKMIGAMVVLNFKIAALGRKPESPKFHLFIDECQNFLGGVDFETFASEMRKFNIPLFLVTQYLDHFPSLSALFGNFPNGIMYRVSGKDAMILEDNFLFAGLANQLVNLPNYHFVAHYIQDDTPTTSGDTTAKSKVKHGKDDPPAKAVIAESIRRWGADRAEIEKKQLALLKRPPGIPAPPKKKRAKKVLA